MLLNLNIREDVDIPSLERMIARIEENENLQLDGLQRKGVMEAARNGVLVITGDRVQENHDHQFHHQIF